MAASLNAVQNIGHTSPTRVEGYEKRLELNFFSAPYFVDPCGLGLRLLSRYHINSILEAARCKIVSCLSNEFCDSYILLESSLFVYPHKMILKTSGTTQPLVAIPRILGLAAYLYLPVLSAKYSRGSFTFPDAQPTPHHCFSEEVAVLNSYFGNLQSGSNSYVIGDPNAPDRNWHVYYASQRPEPPLVTMEMCMTDLDIFCASVFSRELDGYLMTANDMTKCSGILGIIPEMQICDFANDPCGYSMNGINGRTLSTIHVLPEDEFSYASYELLGINPGLVNYRSLIERVLRCFRPSEFSIAVTVFGGQEWARSWVDNVDVAGYACRDFVVQELPNGGLIVYQNFCASGTSPKSILHLWGREDSDEMSMGELDSEEEWYSEEEMDFD